MAAKPSLATYKLPIETSLIHFMKIASQMIEDCVGGGEGGSVAAEEGRLLMFWAVWMACV